MTLPPPRIRQPAPRGFADIPLEDEEEEMEQNFDVPQSQEMKPDSYPNGPIRIYESGVDLYFEPDRHVASRYDVIMNVASEVKNPFGLGNGVAPSATLPQLSSNFGVLAEGSEAAASPDTPKATPISIQIPTLNLPPTSAPSQQPEYIHIPWEHNTDIVPDLPRLVRLIDDRVSQGKTVLVHCQCGVSRSASLIVAYGLYKNPGLSVQEAYDAVKKRSKWIGPNMNLIMQLQEFRSGLLRNSRRDNAYQGQLFTMPRKLSTTLSSASTNGSFDIASGSVSGPVTPRTAPLVPDMQSPTTRARSGSLGPFSAAPVEQGEASFWDAGFRRSWGSGPASSGLDLNRVSIVSDTPWVDTMGHVVPMVTVIQQESMTETTTMNLKPQESFKDSFQEQKMDRIKSLKRKTPNFSRQLPLRRDYDMDTSMIDPPSFQLPDLMSPRAEEFHMVGIEKEHTPNNTDSFGILSPIATEFPKDTFGGSFGQIASATPPKQHTRFAFTSTAPPKEHTGFAFFPADWKEPEPFALKSPTTAEFNLGPAPNDSLYPSRLLSAASRRGPPKSLKTKYSSPNLQESKRLHQMQDEIEASLPYAGSPKRHFDDLDALMSPRAVEFTVNPWDELLSVKPAKPQAEQPTTPTSSEVDPRSPAQHGISPIVRNIFDVL
jgi:tyrosine-protein phosphatase